MGPSSPLDCEEIRIEDVLDHLALTVAEFNWLGKDRAKHVQKELVRLQGYCQNLSDPKKPIEIDDVQGFHEAGLAIWSELYQRAMSELAIDSRGIDELDEYTQRFAKFEDFLYDAVDRYRDHILHSLWVYALGEWCIRKFARARCDPLYIPFLAHDSLEAKPGRVMGYLEYEEITRNLVKKLGGFPESTIIKETLPGWHSGLAKLYKTRSEIWAVAALLHDIGYPLAKVSKVEDEIRKTLGSYGPFYPSELEVHWSPIQAQSVSRFIDHCSKDLVYQGYVRNLLGKGDVRESEIVHDTHLSSMLSRSIEDRKHGILGSYLLYRLTKAFKHLFPTRIIRKNEPWWFFTFLARVNILRAISAHTMPDVTYDYFPQFGAYLFLMDELEDALRLYKFPGEKRYRVRPVRSFFGVDRETLDGRDVILLGLRVEDSFEDPKEDPGKAFAHRFNKLFRFLNADRVHHASPVVIHLEYFYQVSGTEFRGEMQFLYPEVGIWMKQLSGKNKVGLGSETAIDKFLREKGVRLTQRWRRVRYPKIEVRPIS